MEIGNVMYSHDGKSGWWKGRCWNRNRRPGESRGRARDYISEKAGEADLIQVWGFALTSGRLCWETSVVLR